MFNRAKDSILHDLMDIENAQNEILAVRLGVGEDNQNLNEQSRKEKIDLLTNKLFSIESLRSFRLGIADNLRETYRHIAGIDNSVPFTTETLDPAINKLKAKLEQAQENSEKELLTKQIDNLERVKTLTNNNSTFTQAMHLGLAEC